MCRLYSPATSKRVFVLLDQAERAPVDVHVRAEQARAFGDDLRRSRQLAQIGQRVVERQQEAVAHRAAVLLGDVDAVDEDAADFAGDVAQRLEDKVDERLLEPAIRSAAHFDRTAVPT